MSTENLDIHKTKEKILDAAREEFAAKGYDGARMASIAKRSGVNQALIHYYFKDKDFLYESVVEGHCNEEEWEPFFSYLEGLNLSYSEKLYIIIYFFLRFHLDMNGAHADLYRIIRWEIARKGRHFAYFLSRNFIPEIEYILNIVRKGVEAGEFETENPLWAVLNILLSLDILTPHWKDLLQGTEWYDEFFAKNRREGLMSYFIRSVFKSLSPRKEMCVVPDIPREIINQLDTMLTNIYTKD